MSPRTAESGGLVIGDRAENLGAARCSHGYHAWHAARSAHVSPAARIDDYAVGSGPAAEYEVCHVARGFCLAGLIRCGFFYFSTKSEGTVLSRSDTSQCARPIGLCHGDVPPRRLDSRNRRQSGAPSGFATAGTSSDDSPAVCRGDFELTSRKYKTRCACWCRVGDAPRRSQVVRATSTGRQIDPSAV